MMTDEEALATATNLLTKDMDNPNYPLMRPTWREVIDLCLWVKDISTRLPQPKKTRGEYMRDYMRDYRAKKRAEKELVDVGTKEEQSPRIFGK